MFIQEYSYLTKFFLKPCILHFFLDCWIISNAMHSGMHKLRKTSPSLKHWSWEKQRLLQDSSLTGCDIHPVSLLLWWPQTVTGRKENSELSSLQWSLHFTLWWSSLQRRLSLCTYAEQLQAWLMCFSFFYIVLYKHVPGCILLCSVM